MVASAEIDRIVSVVQTIDPITMLRLYKHIDPYSLGCVKPVRDTYICICISTGVKKSIHIFSCIPKYSNNIF